MDVPWVTSWGFGRLGHSAALLGDLAAAEEYANRALQEGVGFGDLEARLVLAEVALARGDPDGERLAAEALDAAEADGYRYRPTRLGLLARTLRSLFAEYGGIEVNRIGGGFFVAFDRADAAIRCAVEIQRALAATGLTTASPPASASASTKRKPPARAPTTRAAASTKEPASPERPTATRF